MATLNIPDKIQRIFIAVVLGITEVLYISTNEQLEI